MYYDYRSYMVCNWNYLMSCEKCGMDKENIDYWDNHQTMSDYNVWCARSKRKG